MEFPREALSNPGTPIGVKAEPMSPLVGPTENLFGTGTPSTSQAQMDPVQLQAIIAGRAMKGKSIVWAHIRVLDDSDFKAECMHCDAEFSIRGGTSAVLRHLKAMHPGQIDYDPAAPLRKRDGTGKKRKGDGESTRVSDETKTYVDALLRQFVVDAENNGDEGSSSSSSHHSDAVAVQLEEFMQSLPQDDNAPEEDDDQNGIRRLLGLLEDQPAEDLVVGVGPEPIEVDEMEVQEDGEVKFNKAEKVDREVTPPRRQHEEGPSSAASSGFHSQEKRKRRVVEAMPVLKAHPQPRENLDKFSIFSSRQPSASSMGFPSGLCAFPDDLETRQLYKQSLHATIFREEAMARYYMLKTRKLEIELEKTAMENGQL